MSVRLYVGNLPKEPIDRSDLQAVFADAGESVSTKVIKDRKTGKCRGFAFVTVPDDEMADALIEKHNGQPFMDSALKIEKALPRSKGKEDEGSASGSASASASEAAPSRAPNKKGKKRSRPSGGSSDSGSVQPDPRWADELAKLKEMLNTQTTNS